MTESNPSAELTQIALTSEDEAALQLAETLPFLLVSLLERRYLSGFQPSNWHLERRSPDAHRPLLREITSIGRPSHPEAWGHAMPHVLTACHDPGHALVMALHGQGNRHRLYLGGRRMTGFAARSTEEYLEGQESAFKAFFTGLQTGPLMRLDSEEMPEMAQFLQTAPALAVVTGIPSGRGGRLPLDLQSLDRLVRAMGNQHYVLMVLAEPLDPGTIDQTLDICRRLKSEVHAYTRRTISRSKGENESVSYTDRKESQTGKLPFQLLGLAAFCQLAGIVLPFGAGLSHFASAALPLASMTNLLAMREEAAHSRQISSGKSWSEAGTLELLNTNAEACETLLQHHIDRLQQGRSNGWWQTAIYIAAESEAAAYTVSGALRSLCSGDITTLDPIRTLFLPEHTLRTAIETGQVLSLLPTHGDQTHPFGSSFDTLGTCLHSEELAVLVNLPQHEIPGLPIRELSDFALSVPPPTEDSITLGSLQDNLGHDLGPVTITTAALNRHVLVTGITGYGKTNTCMQMLLEAYEKQGIPFLVVEPAKAEYRNLVQIPTLANTLRVFAVGDPGALPFRLNPLSPLPGIPLGRHIDLLKAVFNASFPMFAGMPYVLEEAILEVYTERGWSLFTSDNPFLDQRAGLDERSALLPNLEDLHDKIEVVLARRRYGQEIHQNMGAALRARLRSLMIGNKGLMLNTRRSTALEDLFHSPAVIELQNLGDDEEKAFVMAILFVMLYEYAEIRQQDLPMSYHGKLQHLTLIEEAHRLLQATRGPLSAESGNPQAKAVSMFTDMLAEMRAYGEGFIIADQIPTKLATETLKNSNLKIIHRLAAPDDRQIAGSAINLSEQQMRHLNTLAPGFAIVHDERIAEAVLTRINPVKETRAPEGGEAAQRLASQADNRLDKVYLYRNAGCHFCPQPCNFYHRLEETANQESMAHALHPFFERLILGTEEHAWRAWTDWFIRWRQDGQAVSGAQGERAVGITYCAVIQEAYRWLGEFLLARNQQLSKDRPLSPADRLRRERAIRAVGKLCILWVQKAQLDEQARTTFREARQELLQTVADAPPRELPGCQQCPGRCRALPFITPHLAKLEKFLGTKVPNNLSIDTRLEIVRLAAEQHIPLFSHPQIEKEAENLLLYCLIGNLGNGEDNTGKGEEILRQLREQA